RSQRAQSRSRCAARSRRDDNVGERGLLVHSLQHAQRQPAPQRSAHEPGPQTQTAKMAAVRPCYICRAATRPLETLCRSRVLERRTERLASIHEKRETFKIRTSAGFCLLRTFRVVSPV